MKEVKVVRYSEAFKLEVIKHYEQSSLTKHEIMKLYGIGGSVTFDRWLLKYGKESLLNRIIRVEKPDERKRLKELEAENQKLKNALAQAHIKQVTSESFLEVVSEMMGMSVEQLKKKLGEK
jgi:transposase-like protein